MTELEPIVRLVRPVAAMIASLSIAERIVLLEALMAQEMCNMPFSDRDEAMRDHLREFPRVLDETEKGMRQALAENARHGHD